MIHKNLERVEVSVSRVMGRLFRLMHPLKITTDASNNIE